MKRLQKWEKTDLWIEVVRVTWWMYQIEKYARKGGWKGEATIFQQLLWGMESIARGGMKYQEEKEKELEELRNER